MAVIERCRLCGGPVVKGKCSLCGMPFKDEEKMYHLNENRRDHYTHVSDSTRERMMEREIPMGETSRSRTGTPGTPRPAQPQRTAGTAGRTTGQNGKKSGGSMVAMIYVIIVVIFLLAGMLRGSF